MNTTVQSLITSVTPRRRDRPPVTHADLHRESEALSAQLNRAGTNLGALLDVVDRIGPAGHLLSSVAREHRKVHGKTHAVRVAEAALRDALTLESDPQPTERYLTDIYLRTRLWEVVRGMERARVALRWEQIDGPIAPADEDLYSRLRIRL